MIVYNHTGCRILHDSYDVYRGSHYVPDADWELPYSFIREYLQDRSSILLISPEYADIPNRPKEVRIPVGLEWHPDEQYFTFESVSEPRSSAPGTDHLVRFEECYPNLKTQAKYLGVLHNATGRQIAQLFGHVDGAPVEKLITWATEPQKFQREIISKLKRHHNG